MSLIVAIKKDGIVYMGADTRTTCADRYILNFVEDEMKIHRMGDCLVGAAGNVANIQHMSSHPEWFDLGGKPLTKKHIVQNVIPEFYDALNADDKLEKKDKESSRPKSRCSFLITDGVGLFMINDVFEVIELLRYGAIGCTKITATTNMLSMSDDSSPNEIILRALRMSARFDGGVGAPYFLINTREKEFQLVEE